MHWQYSSLVLLVTAATAATLLTLFAWRRRHAPGTLPFILLMISRDPPQIECDEVATHLHPWKLVKPVFIRLSH